MSPIGNIQGPRTRCFPRAEGLQAFAALYLILFSDSDPIVRAESRSFPKRPLAPYFSVSTQSPRLQDETAFRAPTSWRQCESRDAGLPLSVLPPPDALSRPPAATAAGPWTEVLQTIRLPFDLPVPSKKLYGTVGVIRVRSEFFQPRIRSQIALWMQSAKVDVLLRSPALTKGGFMHALTFILPVFSMIIACYFVSKGFWR